MAELTLLTMTQNVLSALGSDEVNSIGDTTESLQVANIIQNKYYDILTRGGLPEDDQLFQLVPSNDNTMPALMYVPDGCSKIKWIKYFDSNPADGASVQSTQFGAFSHGLNTNIVSTTTWLTTSVTSNTIGLGAKTFVLASSTLPITVGSSVTAAAGTNSMSGTVTSYVGTTLVMNSTSTIGSGTFTSWIVNSSSSSATPGYKYVTVLPIEQFLDMVNMYNPTETNVRSFTFTETGNNFTFYYKNNHQPTYCTVISNNFIVFDSYDNTQDSTLQASKTLCFGQVVPQFSLTDNFIPTLDDNKFPLLLNEAKALAFYELKQQPHIKAEQEIKRQWSTVQKNKSISNKLTYFEQLPNFARMPRTGGYGGYIYGPRLFS